MSGGPGKNICERGTEKDVESVRVHAVEVVLVLTKPSCFSESIKRVPVVHHGSNHFAEEASLQQVDLALV